MLPLPHPPSLATSIGPVLETLSIVGTFVFAASGALAAARLRQTLVTFAFFALVTGVGGGTVRDLLIGAPVFWVVDPVPAAAMSRSIRAASGPFGTISPIVMTLRRTMLCAGPLSSNTETMMLRVAVEVLDVKDA